MSKRVILVTGGARSGKSRFAQGLADDLSRQVLFVATAEPLNADMQARIGRHREERPPQWQTLEAPVNLAAEIELHIADHVVVLVDCLTLLTSNIILGHTRGLAEPLQIDEAAAQQQVLGEIEALIHLMKSATATFVIVSNEVGLGLVPDNELGRIYRDVLGRVNQSIAEFADEVHLLVAGIPMKIK